MAFDAHTYFESIRDKNKMLIAGNYKYCRVTGLANMEDVITSFKKEKAYFCVDATEDGDTFQSAGGAFMERRVHTLFVLKKFPYNDMPAQDEALNECRQIYRSILRKLVRDRALLENEMVYLQVLRIPFHEIPGYAISGCTGLYFNVTIDIPIDLCYKSDEWTE